MLFFGEIFTDKGEERIERAVLGISGYLLEQCGTYDYFGGVDELKEFVTARDPKRIGLNYSKNFGGAKLRVALEDDAVITERGIEWLYPINPGVLMIR